MLNRNLSRLPGSYLFPEVERRKKACTADDLIDLGIGDTKLPLPSVVANAMADFARDQADSGYRGYGPEEGWEELRAAIAKRIYHDQLTADEIFISDGAGPDLGRLHFLFDPSMPVAIQDPTYPAYFDSSLIAGRPDPILLPCTPENNFFPEEIPANTLIILCSPNNPTGAVATRKQLTSIVRQAQNKGSFILFDAAYAGFISDPDLPSFIFEIPGAEEVAIEIGSFSKLAGFTGIRLGWTAVPKATKLNPAWRRIVQTLFNGPSSIAQVGGLSALNNWAQIQANIATTGENAQILLQALRNHKPSGGLHAPYIWLPFPNQDSWELFDTLLHEAHIVTTPGVGFGPSGQSYLRLSAFNHRPAILEAAKRLTSSNLFAFSPS